MQFQQDITVTASPEQVWAFLWDIQRVAACIPGCQSAREVEAGKRYEAMVGQRVGPFKVQFPLDIEVVEAQPPTRLRAQATGRDNSMGSSLKMQLDVEVGGGSGATSLRLRTDVTILGKLAALGHSIITRKADEIMAQFAASLRRELEGSGAPTL